MLKFIASIPKSLRIPVCLLIYIISTIPVGMFFYTIKSGLGWDTFSGTGYHAYLTCLKQETGKIGEDAAKKASKEK